MSQLTSPANADAVFRIDKFIVPAAAMPAFIDRLRRTREALSALPGCRQNLVLTQTGGPGRFNVITFVEWADVNAIAGAQETMKRAYAEEGFDPTAFMQGLGVQGDIGNYRAEFGG